MMVIRRKRTLFDWVNAGLLALGAVLTILPFYNIIIISFANNADYLRRSVYLLPTSFDLTSYATVLQNPYLFRAIGVTLFNTVVGTMLNMLLTSISAYALSKEHIPGTRLIMKLILFTMFFSGGLMPFYFVVTRLHLVNSLLVMIVPSAISTFYLIMLRNYYQGLPPSIEESAKMDGANDIYILFRIVIPTSIPIMTTLILFYAVDRWNEYYNALLFLNAKALYPLQLFLREVIRNFISVPFLQARIETSRGKLNTTSMQMAIICISIVPIACIYPFVQRHFTKGILLGAVKE